MTCHVASFYQLSATNANTYVIPPIMLHPTNRYTTSASQSSCSGIECVAGKYGPAAQNSSSAATCTDCAEGTFTSVTGTVTCSDKALKKCGAGQAYTEGTASADDSSCATCAPGRWNNAGDASACALKSVQTCIAGKAYTEGSTTADDSSCVNCVAGKWNNANDTTGCADKSIQTCSVGFKYLEGSTGADDSACVAIIRAPSPSSSPTPSPATDGSSGVIGATPSSASGTKLGIVPAECWVDFLLSLPVAVSSYGAKNGLDDKGTLNIFICLVVIMRKAPHISRALLVSN